MRATLANAIVAYTLLQTAHSFYLPGVAPSSYSQGDRVPLYVNALTPSVSFRDDQVHAVVSFDYYFLAFRFPQPNGGPQLVRESLGSILFGDRIQTSPLELTMGVNETCKSAGESRPFDDRAAAFTNARIQEAYNVNLLVDGLPAAQVEEEDPLTHELYTTPGFPLGDVLDDGTPILNNHWDIVIDYHKAGLRGLKYRVVGVVVLPQSRSGSRWQDGHAVCDFNSGPVILNQQGQTHVTYTYSVYWRESETAWATRWDRYLHVIDPKIHWFWLVNMTVFVIFLVGMVSAVLVRALRKDIARYSRLDNINLDDLSGNADTEDDLQEDSGWKLVHGDVFRPPRHPLLLSILLGGGAQLFVMVGVTVALAMMGFLSPSSRGLLTTVALLLYTLFGFIGGYFSARAYKTFGGEMWKVNFVATPLFIPGVVFCSFFLLNLVVWAKGSSGAVPFTTMLAIISIWFIISVPLSVAGSWYGFKQPVADAPTRVNQIPRQIPPTSRSLQRLPSLLLTGLLPFATIFIELYFIMTSLWTGKVYYMFGFLFICYGLMVVTSACTTVLLVYFLLCAEDYRWQWRAFLGAGMTGGYVFLHALAFWVTRLSFGGLTGAVLYVGYSALISFLVFVLTGSVGFIASYFFVHRIYGSIKVD